MTETELNPELRQRILRRFESWLDESLESGGAPDGIAAEILAEIGAESEEAPFEDFYSMWAAITALTQEVRLQGRAFKQLGSSIENAAGIATAVEQLKEITGQSRQERQERERALERDAAARARKETLEALLNLRDSLTRGLESARAALIPVAPSGRMAKWFASGDIAAAQASAREAFHALEKGYLLSLERLDETLESMDVHPIHCEGQMFNPLEMNAVDLEETTAAAEGTVTTVYRTGYRWHGEVYRVAQVRVSRAPGAREGSQQE